MAMAATQQHIALARTLPKPLLHFLTRCPPAQIGGNSPIPSSPIASNTSSLDPNAPVAELSAPPPTPLSTSLNPLWKKNPFVAHKNPHTQTWHAPHYSLRRQALLFSLARDHHVLPLLPPSSKHPEIREQKRIEHGLRTKGTGAGQKVKGKLWERTQKTRLEVRRKAMSSMGDMVNLWKERGRGRGWKKFPSGKGRSGGKTGEDVFDSGMRHAWVHERAPTS